MGTLIRGDKVLLKSGSMPYVGNNGNWIIDGKDTKIQATTKFFFKTQDEFISEYDEGIYFVVGDGGIVNTWLIDNSGNRHFIHGNLPTPTISKNGNWVVAGKDTGVSAVSKVSFTEVTVYASNWVVNDVGIYEQVIDVPELPDNCFVKLELNYGNESVGVARLLWYEFSKITHSSTSMNKLKLQCLSSAPSANLNVKLYYADLGSCYNIDVVIDDGKVDLKSTYSSYKINQLFDALNLAEHGKNLEYKWDGTKLGVRQEGSENYNFSELRGLQGINGADGSSVVGANIDDRGHLILTVQDVDDTEWTHKTLSLDDSEITAEQIVNMMNQIAKLNKEVAELKELIMQL